MTYSVLVTGASRGIGLELCSQYAADGWRVFACCRSPEKAPGLQGLVGKHPGLVSPHRLDVREPAQIAQLASEVRAEPVDHLINNAGIFGSRAASSFGADAGEWMEVLRTNLLGPVKVAEALAPNVAAGERKVMAFVSSLLGSLEDNGSGGYLMYRTSKAALTMAVRTLSVELRPKGVLAVALCPGWVRTDMGGEGAPLSPRQSVEGIRKVLSALKPRDSGAFINWDGKRAPW